MATGLQLGNSTYWDATGVEIPYGGGHQTLQGLCNYQIQSGTFTGALAVNTANTYTVTFPTAFGSSAVVKVFIAIQKSAGGYYVGDSAGWVYNVTYTGFKCCLAAQGIGGNAGSCTVHWIAMDVSTNNSISTGKTIKTADGYPWVGPNVYDSSRKKAITTLVPKMDCGTTSFSAPAGNNEAHITINFNKTFSAAPKVALTYGVSTTPVQNYGSITLHIASISATSMTIHYYAYSNSVGAHTGYIHWIAIGS